ncbi:MAG: pimeloyl-ACP methyl ester carboxylesterase [Neolewinella sp.]|jgi:pimeloyl-ACP methyl ester carboxylesterase
MKKQRSGALRMLALGLVTAAGCHSIDVDKAMHNVVLEHASLLPDTIATGPHADHVDEHRDATSTLPHVWAIYNDDSDLINEPLADLQGLLAANAEPFTDVFVISHGWNFTTQTGIQSYDRFLHNLSAKRELMRHSMGGKFRPLVVCISWASVSQPLQSVSASVLPQGLDHLVKPFAAVLDEPFHLLSSWNESNRALLAAVGHIDARSEPWGQEGGNLNFGVGSLVRRICDEEKVERVHMVGHSFGAKLITLSAIKASHGPDASDKLQSLVLFNPAFHPRELIYDVEGMKKADIAVALLKIPTKAIVHSSWDYATGSIFGASQIVGNAAWIQWFRDGVDEIPFPPLRYLVGGVASIAQIGVSMVDWLGYTAVFIPCDWWHHVTTNDSFGEPGVLTGALNAVHFFAPLDVLWQPVASDKLGLFRPTYQALGRAGLDNHSTGRPAHHPLLSFVGEGSQRGSEDFIKMCAHIHMKKADGLPRFDNPTRIYSFDASDVFDSWLSAAGSHGDLREEAAVSTVNIPGRSDPYVLEKIDCTVNFVFNMTAARRRL